MKVRVINSKGLKWEFETVAKAKPFIRKEKYDNYKIIEEDGEKIRVYDDREEEVEY